MNSIFRAKRGNAVLDTTFLMLILFMFLIFSLTAGIVFKSLNDDVQADDDFDNSTKQLVQTQYDNYGTTLDNGFLMVFVLAWALMLVASFMSESHPIFFVLTIILMLFVFIAAAIIGNTYETLVGETDFANLLSDFPKSHWIMTHLLETVIIVGFSIAIVLFAKKRYE